jgi:hypothetical protein
MLVLRLRLGAASPLLGVEHIQLRACVWHPSHADQAFWLRRKGC